MGWSMSAGNPNIYALNARNGALLWSYNTGSQVYSSLALVDGVVYAGANNGNLYALNASTGALLWSYTYRRPSRPAVGLRS